MSSSVRSCPRCKAAHPGPVAIGVELTCDTCAHRWIPQGSDEYMPVEGSRVAAALTERRTPPKTIPSPDGGLPFDRLEEESRRAGRTPHPVSELSFKPSTDNLGDRTHCPVCGHGFIGKPGSDDQRCPACGTSFQRSTGRLTPGAGAGTDRLIGRILRGCQIDRKLGEGGMGAVYHAKQLSLDRSVAIKVLPPELARNRNFIQRFEREAKSLARINHANILQIHDFGDDQQLGVYFMIIEYVDGWDLGEVLRRQPTLSQIETLDILRQALLGLEQAAEKGVIHRDIKPDNLMVATSGLCKVSDFGLAKGSAGDSEVTSVGVRVGTPAFMSPEQCDGIEVDTRSDVYNLGCTAFLMLTGHLPYDGETPFSIMLKHKVDPVPSVRTYRADIEPRVDNLVRRMMQKKPDDRCFDLRELVDEAENLLVELTGTSSVLRKTNGPIRALVQHAGEQGSSGKRPGQHEDLQVEVGAAGPPPIPGAKPSGRQRAQQPAPGAGTGVPDWLRPVDASGPAATPPSPPAQGAPVGSRTAASPAIGSRTAPAPAIGSRTGPAAAIGSRIARPAGSQVVPPPTLATPFPGLATPLPSDRRAGSSSSMIAPGVMDRARERGIKAEVAAITAAAERLAASGSWDAAASEFRRASGLARETGESKRLTDMANDAASRAGSRRRMRGLVIGAFSAVLLGVNLWIWPPVVHNLLAERERVGIESIADPGERSRQLRAFAAANQGGWRWYRGIFQRGYEVPAAAAAAAAADRPQVPLRQVPSPGESKVPKPVPAKPELVAPAVPVPDPMAQRQAAIEQARAQGRHGEALDLVEQSMAANPGIRAASWLPLPARLQVTESGTGAIVSGLRVRVDGVELSAFDGRFCRSILADTQIEAVATGYAPARVVLPASANPAEQRVEMTLAAAPVWRLAAPAQRPAWSELHAVGNAALALTPEAAFVIDTATGGVRPLTLPGTALMPWWSLVDGAFSFATADGEQRQVLPTLDRAVPVRRLAGAPLARLDIELVYRAGSRLAVTVEQEGNQRVLVARDGDREVWRQPGIAPGALPRLYRGDDKIVVIDALSVRVIEEDGSESARTTFRAARTGPMADLPGGRILVATTTGVELVKLGSGGAKVVAHPWLAEAGPAVPASDGDQVLLARNDRAVDIAVWPADPVQPRWRINLQGRPLQAVMSDGLAAVGDDSGQITVIRLADGVVVRRIAHGVPVMSPPLLMSGVVIVADQTGAIAGYRF